MVREHGGKGHADGGDVAVAAHFGHKAAAGTKHAPHLREHVVLARTQCRTALEKTASKVWSG